MNERTEELLRVSLCDSLFLPLCYDSTSVWKPVSTCHYGITESSESVCPPGRRLSNQPRVFYQSGVSLRHVAGKSRFGGEASRKPEDRQKSSHILSDPALIITLVLWLVSDWFFYLSPLIPNSQETRCNCYPLKVNKYRHVRKNTYAQSQLFFQRVLMRPSMPQELGHVKGASAQATVPGLQ